MKLKNLTKWGVMVVALAFSGCQEDQEVVQQSDIAKETLDKIYQMGFGTKEVQRVDNGYLVEGDIFLTEAALNDQHDPRFLRVGETEQYRTNSLVTPGASSVNPRVITVSVSSRLPASYKNGTQVAIDRYNAENLLIKFLLVSSGGNIVLEKANGSYLASAGFPTGGNPYGSVKVNSRAIGDGNTATFYNYVGTIIAHEMGHCIGFRHTDYMDRSYSCGGSTANEGASTVGAVQIPGTPAAADPNSWMLACIGSGQSRPFNNNDKTALNYLY
ncbi:M57 family metalloprotease [Adhaeribacter pallidiroseus]|uniref:Protease n=1 Tax=Adhaeribacter pallidiroseus TaxID=2072847 RepID=A0A369QE23_9BACT|nr:M57 family metalloprotease [Adhaeribacter pallidiroseus]RDC61815.1 hypothetical protein AHMF7616_00404 [Adhaeribacter pallidiroseus]